MMIVREQITPRMSLELYNRAVQEQEEAPPKVVRK